MPHDPYKALYIHIPFCRSRCSYCDFVTEARSVDDPFIDEYLESLILALRIQAKAGELASIESVYIGGGTPSHIGSRRLTSLLYALGLSCDLTREGIEVTLEANPESLQVSLVRDLYALGVNRLSLGVQSFDDDLLRFLGRPHSAEDARRAIAAAQDRFDNVSVDLMCAVPGQSLEVLEASLQEAMDLGVTHLSVYPLAIEPHTPLDRLLLAGELEEVEEDQAADAMILARDLLEAKGYKRYEVASYAAEGYRCRHNIAYWTGIPYLGIGRGAATMTQNAERRMRMVDGAIEDDLNRRQMEAEDLMLSMRLRDGISGERLQRASEFLPDARNTLADLAAEGYVEPWEGGFRPTDQGWLCGNALFGALMELGQR